MLALNPVVVEAVWQAFAAYLPEHEEKTPSTRLSSTTRPGSGLLRGDPFPIGHRVQLGRGRSPWQGPRDDAAPSQR